MSERELQRDSEEQRLTEAPLAPAGDSAAQDLERAEQVRRRPSALVVIVNWKQPELTIRAARSIASQLNQGDRLVVVDNASGDGSAELIRKAGYEVIEASENAGFAAGVNLGAQELSEDVLVLLNNDAQAQPGYLDALLAPLADSDTGSTARRSAPGGAAAEHAAAAADAAAKAASSDSPRLGATTALLLLSGRWQPAKPGDPAETGIDGQRWTRVDDEAEARSEGVLLVNSTGNMVDAAGNGYDRDWLTPLTELHAGPAVFGICGGACAISVTAWRELRGLREDLFMYYEDTDFSYRLREAGYSVRFVEDAVALHEHAASSGSESDLFIRVNTRNRILVTAEHAPKAVLAQALARTSMRSAKELLSQRRRGPVTQGLMEALGRMARRRKML